MSSGIRTGCSHGKADSRRGAGGVRGTPRSTPECHSDGSIPQPVPSPRARRPRFTEAVFRSDADRTAYERFDRWEADGNRIRLLEQVQVRDDSVGAVEWTVSVDSALNRAHQHTGGTDPQRGAAEGNELEDPTRSAARGASDRSWQATPQARRGVGGRGNQCLASRGRRRSPRRRCWHPRTSAVRSRSQPRRWSACLRGPPLKPPCCHRRS